MGPSLFIESACALRVSEVKLEERSNRFDLGDPSNMINITRRDIDAAYKYANDGLSRARDPDARGASRVLGKMLETGEVIAGAAAVGVASGRFGPLNINNTQVPLDLVGGVSGHLIAFWLGSGVGDHLHNFSNGVLAGYFTKLGVGLGTTLRMKAGMTPFTVFTGDKDKEGHGGLDFGFPSREVNLPFDVAGEQARLHGGMPAYGAGAETGGPLTEAELAALAQQVR
jgi:hypothetical protein